MGAMILMTFRSVSQTIALLLMIPFGYIGMVWGHYIHGHPISILSSLGFIALIGVIVNDGLVFVAAFNGYLQKGMKFNEALHETAMSRFRPIFLTTITTTAGLAPLIFETSFQAQFLVPMAITLSYGLLVGSLILTLLLPVLLWTFNQVKIHAYWLWEGKKLTQEEMEKAIIRQRKEEHYQEV
jgi:multidrug efflux pump subunit AcrB